MAGLRNNYTRNINTGARKGSQRLLVCVKPSDLMVHQVSFLKIAILRISRTIDGLTSSKTQSALKQHIISSFVTKMSLKYWILIMLVIAVCSRSSAQFCSRRYVDGKWISEGDCGGADMISERMRDLKRRSEEEKKWTVFQRRKYGNVSFYLGWVDYVKGFGNRHGDFWLGLEELHEMTKDGNMELEINMILKATGTHWVAKYSNFRISPGSDKYSLHVSGFSGNATNDGLVVHNEQQFSTKDADHDSDPNPSRNCATEREGGWWYRDCGNTNLNGNFHNTDDKGFWWERRSNLLRFSEMKMRKRA